MTASWVTLFSGVTMSLVKPSKEKIRAALERIMRAHESLQVTGPCMAQEMPYGELQMLEHFKALYASRFAPYLLNDCHRYLDIFLQRQGKEVYFYVHKDSHITGFLRLRTRPFEWECLLPELQPYAEAYTDCVEFSRLMVEPSVRGMQAGRILIGTATLWAIDEGYGGIVALCRPATYKVFQQYGLSPCGNGSVRVRQRRNDDYFLMHGKWCHIANGKSLDPTSLEH